jgi:hypothetical protein
MKTQRHNAIKRIASRNKSRPALQKLQSYKDYNVVTDSYIAYACKEDIDLEKDCTVQMESAFSCLDHAADTTAVTLDRKLLIKLLKAFKADKIRLRVANNRLNPVAIHAVQDVGCSSYAQVDGSEFGAIMPVKC